MVHRRIASILLCAFAMALAAATLTGVASATRPSGDFGTVRGRIVGGEGRDLSVIVVGKRYGAPVDSNGYFEFANLPAGRHTLLFRGYRCDEVQEPVTVRAGAVDSMVVDLRCSRIPCVKPDQADPECILWDPYAASRVGKSCEVHAHKLRRDLVPIQYGIVGCGSGNDPDRFPNANLCHSRGCIIRPERWAEVAYCDECRAASYSANPLRMRVRPRGWR